MKEGTHSKIWDVALLLMGLILPPASALFLDFMKADLSVPIWVIVSLSLAYSVLFYFMRSRFETETQKQQEDHAKEILTLKQDFEAKIISADAEIKNLSTGLDMTSDYNRSLEHKLDAMKSAVFDGGLYYRTSDTERAQPSCRVCYEDIGKLYTVQVAGEQYWCAHCQQTHFVQVTESEIPKDDKELHF